MEFIISVVEVVLGVLVGKIRVDGENVGLIRIRKVWPDFQNKGLTGKMVRMPIFSTEKKILGRRIWGLVCCFWKVPNYLLSCYYRL